MADLTRPGVTDLIAFLEVGKLTPEDLDGILNVGPGTVRSWRDGVVRIPKEQAKELAHLRASAEYEARVLDLKLPVCATREALWATVAAFPIQAAPSRDSRRAFDEHQAHLKQCTVCRSNEERIERELGKHPLLRDGLGRDMRISVALYSWAAHPWTLVLTLPITIGCGYLAFHTPGGGQAELLRVMYIVLATFGLRLVFPALTTLWDRLRHGTHD